MNLRVSWKKICQWVLLGILGVLVVIYIVKVTSYENWYYNSKEGSNRATAVESSGDEALDETVPTAQQIAEYTVPAAYPRYLSIEKLGITNARILSVGVKTNGELDTPQNIFDVGWYNGSGLPGLGGTLVIDGHNGGPHVLGVFKALPSLGVGEIIKIERGDGKIFSYSVAENVQVPLAESDKYMSTASVSPIPGKESVTLISCSGDWSQAQNTYLARQFVRATIVEE